MREVPIEPLTLAAFAPFGDVISTEREGGLTANAGTAVRHDFAAALETLRPGARANLAIFRSAPQAVPLVLRAVERHPYSTQAFLPLLCARYLVCVCPTLPTGEPDLAGLRAFVATAGVGVNYRPGTWHHGIIALDAPAQFAMLAWEDGTEGDCEVRDLSEPLVATFCAHNL